MQRPPPPPRRQIGERTRATHITPLTGSIGASVEGLRLGRMLGVAESDIPSAIRPLVRTHPETGRKALDLGHADNVVGIEGWTLDESRPLLDDLCRQSTTPDNVMRHPSGNPATS